MMERTRGMALSEQEKTEIEREELEKRSKGFVLKLLANPDLSDEILQPLASESENERKKLRSMIWDTLVRDLPPSQEVLKYLDLMARLPQADAKAAVLKEVRSSFHAALKQQAEDRKKLIGREKRKLADHGISGSAVIPKLPKQASVEEDFGASLEKLKVRLFESPSPV